MNIQPIADANRILVADDDPCVLLLLEAILLKHGFEMVAAQDGREAFRILSNDCNFMGAIFDMVMPYMEGPELIHYMRTEKRLTGIPIAMMSAEQGPKLPASGYSEGAVCFIPKPLNMTTTGAMLGMMTHAKFNAPSLGCEGLGISDERSAD